MTLSLEICSFRQINKKRNAPKIALHIHEYLNKNDGSDQLLNIRLDSFFHNRFEIQNRHEMNDNIHTTIKNKNK